MEATKEEPTTQTGKAKENVKFSPDDTFSSDYGEAGGDDEAKAKASEEHAKEAKLKATPAKLLQKKRTEKPEDFD